MRVEPKEPFRLVVGAELTRMNDSAEIGLSSDSAYLILVAERVSKVGQKAYAKKLLADSLRNMNGKIHGETLEIDLDGRKVTLTRMRNAGQPSFEYLHGVFFEGNRAIQVLAWYLTSLETKAAKILPAAFASIRFLADEENAALRAEMSQGPDNQNRVGTDFSLRRGVYRDFAHGLVWHKPAGFWRIAVGQQARTSNKAASLFIEEAALGIFGLLIIEPSTGLTGPAYHALVQKAAFPGVPELKTQDIKVDGKPANKSEALREINGIKLRYQALSWVHGRHAFQFLFWGIPEAMQSATKAIDAARSGLRLPGRTLRAEANEGATHLDHRFGYRFSPPKEGWSMTDLTPPELRSIGQVLDWKKGNKHVLLVSVCALEPGQDRDWFLTLASQIMQSNMKGLSVIAPTRSTLEHAGIQWDHLAWRGSGKADALLATRDKTFFAIMSASDFFVGLDLKKVVSGFSFLD